MKPLKRVSAVAQVAAHLREELFHGTWSRFMPGVHALAGELGSNHGTVEAALKLLEKQRLLVPQGAGRPRIIRIPYTRNSDRPLRIAILDYDPFGLTESYTIEVMHLLIEAGHKAFFTRQCLLDMRMNVKRIAQLVSHTHADAWIVSSASREVLEWFAAQSKPAFAWFGNRLDVPIAAVGPDKQPAYATATRRLIELGHIKVVLLHRHLQQVPETSGPEKTFLSELADHRVVTSSYNLPHWEETKTGFYECLTKLFSVTPPTALIIDEAPYVFATLQFLMEHGLRVPNDVSLICTDSSPVFSNSWPTVAHIHWDTRPVVRRIVQWANNIAHGRQDKRQTLTPAKFIPGGTIGPVPK